ncbi:hypothetical protein [Maritimibacter fusiformis]|uniref:Uncharacterized protein n=1 Tax=Maritimibacter fusiformis TaxID=2603819 RepID=A0A5D0RRM3_9RHOB|nr:hypothetical protein [Maritimibacter fusiformis]TYB83338.1 hypothetical protein FVF75_03950 [Maritimibacter fusiformis]
MKRMLLTIGMALAGPALAEDPPICGTSSAADWAKIQEIFTGEWLIEHQAGYALFNGMVLPFPGDGEVETITIFQLGDTLQATHPEAQAPLVLRLADEPRWTVDIDNPAIPDPLMTPDDVAMVAGCPQLDLPRLVGTSTAVMDGVPMEFTYRMMAMDWSTLYGIMEIDSVVQGTPIEARRTVWMRLAGR